MKYLRLLCLLMISIFLNNSMNAQQFLDHNTGTVLLSVLDNGVFGLDSSGAYANGFTFNGAANALFSGGVLIATPSSGVNGQVGSFVSNNVPIINDYVNTFALTGFTSDDNFNQITSAAYSDSNATAPIGVSIISETFSNTGDDFVFFRFTLLNNTGADVDSIYSGMFADWDVGGANFTLNRGGYDTLRHMAYQYENGGANDANYYGIVALNDYAGMTLSSVFPGNANTLRGNLFDYITTKNDTAINVNGDYRTFIGAGPYAITDGATAIVGFALVAGSDLADLQANASIAQSKWALLNPLPVELTSFTADINGADVNLNWQTATEIDNYGFEIERSINNTDWDKIGFINGNGTSNITNSYRFTDAPNSFENKVYYRLKQIDFDGGFEYSDPIEVVLTNELSYELSQNYPNPFNPSTKISYTIPQTGFVTISIYNSIGQLVKKLVNEVKQAGKYTFEFNASELPSGIYFYNINSNEFSFTRKMILLK